MKEIRCIIINSNSEILTIKKETYKLPSIISNYKNNKSLLKDLLKTFIKTKVDEDFFIQKLDKENIAYYYCEEPYNDKEFKKNTFLANSFQWVKINEFKDILSNENNKAANELINDLSICLRSNFSYTKEQRVENEKNYDFAIMDNYKEASIYYLKRHMASILNKETSFDELEMECKKELILRLCRDLKEQENNLFEKYLEILRNTELMKLTAEEAKKINKYEEWNDIFENISMLLRFIPIPPNYFEKEFKLQSKKDITPYIVMNLYEKYKDQTSKFIKKKY